MNSRSSPDYVQVGTDQAPLAYRLRQPLDGSGTPFVMLHGLSGDERSMWALESAVPSNALAVAPRGPYPQGQGGYAWNPVIRAWPPTVDEFAESVARLDELLIQLERSYAFQRGRMILMGFSNGAAMAFAAAMTPLSVQPAGIIAMSGHLPQGDLTPLREVPMYWGHGARDEFIPASVARADVDRLEATGARIHYCEADVGHKFGVECLRELRDWYPTLASEGQA